MTKRAGALGHGGTGWAILRAAVPLCLCAFVVGCAYYNGLYNAKRMVKQAERDERAGRMSAASDAWRLAAIHAESTYTRHRNSRWADDARLIRGRALVHLEAWNEATMALSEAVIAAQEFEQRREAFLYLGRANLGARRYQPAREALDSAVLTHDRDRRSQVLLYRGRAWLALRRPDQALADFLASNTDEARYERTRAAVASGDARLAAAFADSLIEMPYREAAWLPLLDSLGKAGLTEQAGHLVDRLVARRDVSSGARARLLIDDGRRWNAAGADTIAAGRYQAVIQSVPDSSEARVAAVRLARLELRYVTDTADVQRIRGLLEAIAEIGGAPALEAAEMVRLLVRADSLAVERDAPDAWWLARAELLRDSLGAATLSANAFAAMAERYPESPWTPKGILNAVAAGHPSSAELLDLLQTRYAESPYTRSVAAGRDDPVRFAALEDSLRATLSQVDAPGNQPVTGDIDPADDPRNRRSRPAVRPQPARPTTRPVDP